MGVSVLSVLLYAVAGLGAVPVLSGCEIDYPPFSFVDDSGAADGLSVELLDATLASMGREATYVTGTWSSVMELLKTGEIECLPLVGRTPEREPFFDFTFPYMTLHGAVVVRSDCDTIRSVEHLRGLTVGVMAGDNAQEFMLRGDYGADLVPTETFQEALLMLSAGQVDAVVMQRLVALRLTAEMGLSDVQVLEWPLMDFRQDFCFAVRKGNAELLALLNEGLALVMADGTYAHLHAKWFAHLEIPTGRTIIVGGDRNFPPYEFLDSLGNPTGMNVEIVRAIAAEAGLSIEIRLGDWSSVIAGLENGSIDAITGMFYSPSRDRHFDFTQPHTVVNYVAVVRSGEAPSSVDSLRGLSLAVERGDIMHEFISENGLSDRASFLPNQEEALAGVVSGEYDCALVGMVAARYLMERNGWDLSLGSTPIYSGDYCIAVAGGNLALKAQFSEGLRVLVETGGYRRIFEKWMGDYVDREPPSLLAVLKSSLVFLVPLLLALALVLLWLRLMRRQVRIKTAQLLRSEGILKTTQEITGIGGWEYDISKGTMFWTEETFRIHGYEPVFEPNDIDVFVKRSLQCYREEDRDLVGEAFRRCVETGEPYEMECRFSSTRGDVEWVRTGGRAFMQNGAVVRVAGYLQDITWEKKAEETAHYRDALLHEMGRIALVGGWEFDPETGRGTWTDEVARIHGLSPDEETSLKKGLGFYNGESRRRILRAVRDAIKEGRPYDLDLELVTPSGEKKWVRTIGRPVMDSGRVVKVQGSFQDITSLKNYENRIEHLNRVLRAIRDINQLIVRETDPVELMDGAVELLVNERSYRSALLVAVDETGSVVSLSRAGLAADSGEIEGMLASGDFPDCFALVSDDGTCSMVDRSACSRCPLGDLSESSGSLAAPLDHGGIRYGFLAVCLEEGVSLDSEETSLLSEMAGDIAYAMASIRERAARVSAEHDRAEMRKQLLQSQKMEAIGQLAGGIAHDFNNMLQVIMGHAQLLQSSLEDTENKQSIAEIVSGARRASDLTRQLLLFSRRQVMSLQSIDFNELVENLLRMIRRLIGEHIRLEWMPGSAVGSVHADPGMMEQVVMNLCVNARDAMPEGGVLTIETMNVLIDSEYCTAHSWASPGRYVLLSVTDTGMGMERAVLERVFEPFFTTKEPGKGTGIGLATVYGIVKQHGGMINAYSEPGKGSLFKIYLPMSELRARKVGARLEGAAVGGTETILLAEDDGMVRNLAKQMLEMGGYTVLEAENGEEAVALFRNNPGTDLLLLDVIMPRLGGKEALERIRAIDPDVPVLFSSGYSENAIHTNFILHDDLTLIQKPYSAEELLRAVRKVLDRT